MALPLRVVDAVSPARSRVEAVAPVITIPFIEPDLAHTIAHDLRSPLTAVQMCAESLAMSDDPQVRRRYSAIIAQQARAMAWALEDLVALADEQSWAAEEPGPVNLSLLVQKALDDLATLVASREIKVELDFPAAGLGAFGHEGALAQMIRACVHVMVSVTPAAGTMIGEGAKVADDPSRVYLALVAEGLPLGLARPGSVSLPWHRLSLLTAARLVRAHEGELFDLHGPDALGVRLELPASDWAS